MKALATSIPEVLVLEPKVFTDSRGFFYESFHQESFTAATRVDCRFVQDNHSRSTLGVLRGLHYQRQNAQAKLLRVTSGRIFDVAVDLRRSSPTFSHWVGVELSEANRRQLWIPEGFAHGYLVLSDTAEVLYKTNRHYAPGDEHCIAWDDPTLGIEWPLDQLAGATVLLSAKDARGLRLKDAELFD